MKQAKMPLYIRFGEIPDGGISYVHLGDYKASRSAWSLLSSPSGRCQRSSDC